MSSSGRLATYVEEYRRNQYYGEVREIQRETGCSTAAIIRLGHMQIHLSERHSEKV